jgi:hypothetical protein
MKARDPETRIVERSRNQGEGIRYNLYPLSDSLYLNVQNRHVAIPTDLVAIQPCLVVVVAPKRRGAGRWG